MSVLPVLCPLLAELLLLFCGAFFAATETAYTSLSRITVRQLVKDGAPNARLVAALRGNLERLISTVLIGTNLVTSLTSSVATAFSLSVLRAEYVTYGTAVISILVIIFSEIIPKTYAAALPERVAERTARPVIALQKAFFPVVWAFDRLSAFLSFVESRLSTQKAPLVTEEELRTLIELGKTEGTLEADEKKMLDRIFEFSDLHCRDIMKNRALLKYIFVSDTVQQVISTFVLSGHSRLPVCDGSPDNVVGVLHYKAVLFAGRQVTESRDFVRICMRPALFVPETLPAVELLRQFKREKMHFAVVVNEYGESAGIVTMNDMLRAVFGRVTDEYGMVDIAPENRIAVAGADEFLVPGDMKLDDVNGVLGLNLYSDNFDTIGGWLLERFDELPPVGAVYADGGIIYLVEDQSARRIQSIRVKLSGAPSAR